MQMEGLVQKKEIQNAEEVDIRPVLKQGIFNLKLVIDIGDGGHVQIEKYI